MDIGQAMRNWKANSGIWGGFNHDQPQSPGMDIANQMQGLGMSPEHQSQWGNAQPGQVQMGGQTVGIPRQPWGFGAMPEAVAESAPVQTALASDETEKPINWAGMAALFSQMQKKPEARPMNLQAAGGRGRQIDPDSIGAEQRAMANAILERQRLLAVKQGLDSDGDRYKYRPQTTQRG